MFCSMLLFHPESAFSLKRCLWTLLELDSLHHRVNKVQKNFQKTRHLSSLNSLSHASSFHFSLFLFLFYFSLFLFSITRMWSKQQSRFFLKLHNSPNSLQTLQINPVVMFSSTTVVARLFVGFSIIL